jgi:putative transposase
MRNRYDFVVCGYVIMPEHVHLLVSEPKKALLSKAIQALKLSVSVQSKQRPFWQARYYDFNVHNEEKRVEKLRYMHRNPLSAAWLRSRMTGLGLASGTTQQGSSEPSRSKVNGAPSGAVTACPNFSAIKSRKDEGTLPGLRSETWGTHVGDERGAPFCSLIAKSGSQRAVMGPCQ